MIKGNKLNINVNKDDNNVNDYLYCWSELGHRPSKITIYKNFEKDKFLKKFEKLFQEFISYQDIIPYDSDDLVNERFFCKFGESRWISFTIFDKNSEESFIGEICFYFSESVKEEISNIINDIDISSIDEQDTEADNKINLYTVGLGQSGYELSEIITKDGEFDNIDFYYNDDVLKRVHKLSKKIKNKSKGISIIYGERGTGKTTVVKYLSSLSDNKTFLFIPYSLLDLSINNPEFRNFLKKNKNCCLILDDCESFFTDTYSKYFAFSNNIVQLVDGIDSNDFNLHFLLILNCQKESDFDSQILESNNLVDLIELGPLKKEKVQELCKFLDQKNKFRNQPKLIDVIKNKVSTSDNSDIGFL